ncbi:helix-turn-helix transcriptional regulator [Agromyces seonyuensis]|uniref:WYL domain-containing protein n=1 Tax=Agromyces seonyuensis TaxID=2662446 RepID=A0A6I4P3C8_9MICO|nr:WYL domain-containing protein [Agromyces seonyuensis]MWB97827.1 WYL domain-containing protein [Agromyces seonyuensis]
MAGRADDKLSVLLALVPYLVAQRVVAVEEAAEQLGLTPEAIREAVRLIALTGIAATAGEEPMHDEMFDIDWDAFLDEDVIVLSNAVGIGEYLRFSSSESAALISGLTYLSRLQLGERAAMDDLAARLREGTVGDPMPLLVSSATNGVGTADPDPDDGVLALVVAARDAGRRLEFEYRSGKDETLRRQVDPLQVYSDGPDWYVRGYCHLREGLRNFRLDRMIGPVMTDVPVDDHSDLPLEDGLFHPSDSDLQVVVDVAAGGLPFLVDYLADDERAVVGDRTRVTLRIAHLPGLVRLVSSLPGLVRVVAPEPARLAVEHWAAAAAARYPSEDAGTAAAGDSAR